MLTAEWQRIVQALARATRELRLLLGWSQQQLADKAVTSQGAISRLEAGRCEDVPLRTVVYVLRALACGAVAADLSVSAQTHAILVFVRTFEPTFTFTGPLDPGLVALVRLYHDQAPARRQALLQLVTAAVTLSTPAGGSDGHSPELLLR
jgi:transcriptional regulator with XRE-family HTH domain